MLVTFPVADKKEKILKDVEMNTRSKHKKGKQQNSTLYVAKCTN